MKILVLSDLHLEYGEPLRLPSDLSFDTVVLAGDIHAPGHKAVTWAKRDPAFRGRPVIYVLGNHEFYDREMGAERLRIAEAAEGSNVHVLQRQAVEIEGVRFLGTTLWTDFACPINTPSGPKSDAPAAMAEAMRFVFDYRAITVTDKAAVGWERWLTPADTLKEHRLDIAWLSSQLNRPSAQPTVVVTHHAPSARSIAEKYADDWVTCAFISDLPHEFFERPVLWVHGHTHTSFDYQLGNCRVVCNPRGYRSKEGGSENPAFKPLVVEVR
jgi:predicted phosphodiesterase